VWAFQNDVVYGKFPTEGNSIIKTGVVIHFETVGQLGMFSISALINALLSGIVRQHVINPSSCVLYYTVYCVFPYMIMFFRY
jgi:hypothetical protein